VKASLDNLADYLGVPKYRYGEVEDAVFATVLLIEVIVVAAQFAFYGDGSPSKKAQNSVSRLMLKTSQ
jgi:hypothetical protein